MGGRCREQKSQLSMEGQRAYVHGWLAGWLVGAGPGWLRPKGKTSRAGREGDRWRLPSNRNPRRIRACKQVACLSVVDQCCLGQGARGHSSKHAQRHPGHMSKVTRPAWPPARHWPDELPAAREKEVASGAHPACHLAQKKL